MCFFVVSFFFECFVHSSHTRKVATFEYLFLISDIPYDIPSQLIPFPLGFCVFHFHSYHQFPDKTKSMIPKSQVPTFPYPYPCPNPNPHPSKDKADESSGNYCSSARPGRRRRSGGRGCNSLVLLLEGR